MIRIVIADDFPFLRRGLIEILEEAPDLKVVAEAESADQLLEVLPNTPCDILLLDISMPGPSFIEVLRRLRVSNPGLRILVVSAHREAAYAVRALKAGASGFLGKDRSPEELVMAVRQIHRGGRYLTPELAAQVATELAEPTGRASHEALSNREFEVLAALVGGASQKAAAARLGVSPKTVHTYRSRLLAKLGCASTGELIRYALEHGLVRTSVPTPKQPG